MSDKTPPKYEIKEKTPGKKEVIVADKNLLKKIKEEQKKLEEERIQWELTIQKIKNYKESISDLEYKRKQRENEIKALLNQKEDLTNDLDMLEKQINNAQNELKSRMAIK